MSRVELGVAADEVTDDLRAIYADLRRFAAVVAPVEVEPDDLLQDAVVRVLTSGTWSRVHDLPSYLRRTIVDAAPVVRGSPQPATATERPASEITLISTYPAGLSELTRQGPMARGLLFLVDVEDYLVDEAAVMVGCTPTAALDQLSRARKRIHGDDVRDHLEAMSLRGQVRGVEEVVRSAFDEVADRRAAGEAARPRRPHWRVVVAVSVAVVLVGVLVAFSRRDSGKAHGVADASRSSDAETTPASPRTTFAPTARGWIFDEGVLRDVQDGHQVAAFPMKVAEAPPVRVEGGFVAVLADHNLWFAKELSTESMQLDRLVSGVAASPGGTSIAYATVAGDGRSATLKLVDVATKSLIAQLAVDRFARVVGYSNPEVLLDTGDGAASSAALWDPTGPNRLTFLDAFGTVGGVGRNVAVLRQGDGTCPALVTVRNGAIVPLRNVDLSAGESGCDASRWEFDPSGALVAGFGMIGAPAPIRVSVNRFPVAIGTRRVIAGMWVDSANIAAIDERGQLVTCDVSARCTDVRLVRPQPIAPQSIWMVAPRRDVADDRVVTSTPDTMTPSYLTAVQMVSPSVAFAAGPSAFLRSDDGGRSWQRMAPCRDPLNPCPVNVEHLDMLDASTGWATTNDGLFRTVDGHEWFRARAEGI